MKIVYYNLNFEFELFHDKINSIVIENPLEFERFVLEIANRIAKKETKIELTEDCERLDFTKKVELILSPMDFIYEKREVQKRLLENLIEEIQISELMETFSKHCSEFLESLETLKINTEYELDFEDNFEVGVLLKNFNVHLKAPEGNFAEKLIDYSKNIHRLLGKKVFILISCSSYIHFEDFRYLLEHTKYEDVLFLFVSAHQLNLNLDMNEYIIDMDLCEIH